MDSLKGAPRLKERGREMEQIGTMRQAGRSETVLEAERSSAGIRSQLASSMDAGEMQQIGKLAVDISAEKDSMEGPPQTASSSILSLEMMGTQRRGTIVQAESSEAGLGSELRTEHSSIASRSQSTTLNQINSTSKGGKRSPVVTKSHSSQFAIFERPALKTSRPKSTGSLLSTTGSSRVQGERASRLDLIRRSSYLPTNPSPLNPSSSRSSTDSSGEDVMIGDDKFPVDSSSSGQTSRRQSTGNLSKGAERKRNSENLSPAQKILRQNTMPGSLLSEIARSESPRLLKDLGNDYSRYPLSRSNSLASSRPGLTASDSTTSLLRTTTINPFNDSQADLHKYGFPDDSIGTFDPYFGGEKGFILYEHEVEKDDKWHLPADDDDIVYKAHWTDYVNSRRQLVSTLGGIVLVLGLMCVFIVLPILTYGTHLYYPKGQGNANSTNYDDFGPAWAHVNNKTYPLLKNIRTGLIDPSTPTTAKNRTSIFDGSTLKLVFSDEFNDDNRTFYPGDDPYWTAPNIWYGATQDLEWYDPVAVTTGGGTLQLKLSQNSEHNLKYTSGMLNSWNQLCFKGGVLEISVSLPGPAGVEGLWPGVWTMGNLGRPGYEATTDGVWPYTYNSCDAGITPNQSSPDGLNFLPGQRLNKCTCPGQDHPNPGTGRGAPEIDILEATVTNSLGVVSQSYQVAPFDVFWRPNANFMQIPNYNTTSPNTYCGGPYQQAVSGTTWLNNEWYSGSAYQKYAFEYIPGSSTGKISWFVGEDQTFLMDGRAIGPNGNVGHRYVTEEPMSMILNLGISDSWTYIDYPGLEFPTIMHVDYVRIYQREGNESVTCDPVGYPTTEYIANHLEAYSNPNLTHWNETGYSWPTNTLTGDC